MPSAIAAPEIRRGGAATHELHVHVSLLDLHVPEQAAISVDVVEPRVVDELDVRARRRQPVQLELRLPRVALALAELGGVDLDEPNARSASDVERVAVADPRDDGAFPRDVVRCRRASDEQECEYEPQRDRGRGLAAQTFGSSSRPVRFALSLRSTFQAKARIAPKTRISAATSPTRAQIASKRTMASTPSTRNTIAAPPSFNA
jgi:hypothetical protein